MPGSRWLLKGIFFAAALALLGGGSGAAPAEPVTIGVLAKRGPAHAYQRWEATTRYLTGAIPGHRFGIQPLGFSEVAGAIKREEVDFLLANPAIYVRLAARFGVKKLVTLRNRVEGTGVSRFGGVLFTRSDRTGLESLGDLRGQRMAAVAFNALGGYFMARGLLQRHGLHPETDLAGVNFSGTHDAVVQAVLAGEADFGTVRTGTLERMVAEGRVAAERYRIIHPRQKADFPAAVSTRLYPEWPLARTADTSAELASRVANALKRMPSDAPAARQGRYAGWEPAADYQPVHALLRELGVAPYHDPLNLREVWQRHWVWVTVVAGAVLGVTAGLLYLLVLYRRLRQSRHYSRLLLNSLGEGVFGVDAEGRFTFLNPVALSQFDFANERSVLGQSSHALTHHTDAEGDPYPATECPIYRVMTTGKPLEAWQDRFWRTDGTSFPVEVYASPVTTGDAIQGAVVVFADISERKTREAALHKYSTAFEQSRDAVIFVDPENHALLDANPAALALFRVPSFEAARGSHPSDFSPAYQPDGRPSREAADARIAEAFANGQAFFEWRHQTTDGEPFPAEVQVSRVDRPDGPILEILVRDITDRKEAEANLQRRTEKDATMQAISTNLLAAPYDRINATIEDALARIGQAAEADRSYLFQLADDGRTMSNTHEWTAEGVTAQIQRLQGLPTADFAWLLDQFRRDEVFAIRSLAEIRDPGFRDLLAQQGIRSLLIVPMLQGEQLIGYLGLDAVRSEREWSESEQHLLRIAAGPLAGALARQRLEAELQYQARHDPLTGLLNRRAFEEALAREAHRTQRYGQTFALIMLDIDHFKAINDTYGHLIGDHILQELAASVSERLRGADLLARWGGEEFIALLPDTGKAGARELAEAIRWQVADGDFPGVGHMTISLGVVEYRAYEALKDVTKRVDEALYAAKEGGRNRVVVDGEGRGA